MCTGITYHWQHIWFSMWFNLCYLPFMIMIQVKVLRFQLIISCWCLWRVLQFIISLNLTFVSHAKINTHVNWSNIRSGSLSNRRKIVKHVHAMINLVKRSHNTTGLTIRRFCGLCHDFIPFIIGRKISTLKIHNVACTSLGNGATHDPKVFRKKPNEGLLLLTGTFHLLP